MHGFRFIKNPQDSFLALSLSVKYSVMINYNHIVVVFLLLSLGIFKLGLCTENQSQTNNLTVKCFQSEREALVSFKAGVIDVPGKLSSWVGEDCCQWKGVECDNKSGHVTKLNLSNPAERRRHYEYDGSDNISPIPSLCPLDTTDTTVCQGNGAITSFPTDVKTSVKASFSGDVNASLSGEISPYLGNLSSLTHLDLEGNYNLFTKNLDWVSSLSSLENLYMGGVKIHHTKADWLHAINMLPSLLE
uniref:Leucine-rich repeat-containing N-terminal plant-type domain-containing protein n=1 Tax=Quercus lobata TaxID=97700 RepID=A0A7N2LMC6_QUELO